jgi:hypothetical protein
LRLIHLCLGIAALFLVSNSYGEEWEISPAPTFKPGATIQLRVVHAINDRFPSLSPVQMQILLDTTKATVKQNFGVNVEFSDVSETTVAKLFALNPPSVLKERIPTIYDFKSGTGDKSKIAASLNATFAERGTTLADGLAYAKPYIADAHPKNLRAFSDLLADVMLERLGSWRKIMAADGAPVIDATPYNEWVYWSTLGYGKLQHDLVITNQLIASAEYVALDIHSAIRGGLTVGTTDFNRNGNLGSFVFWSTFPFLDASQNTLLQRGGEQYSETEAAQLSGKYLAHEIGHMLFRLGHPFGQKSCVMNPVSMLRFREWSEQIDSAACTMGSRPEMTAGSVHVYRNTNWLKMSR